MRKVSEVMGVAYSWGSITPETLYPSWRLRGFPIHGVLWSCVSLRHVSHNYLSLREPWVLSWCFKYLLIFET